MGEVIRVFCIVGIVLFGLLGSGAAVADEPEPERDTLWCLSDAANSTIAQQPMRDFCPFVAGGAAIGAWFSNDVAAYVMSKTQQGWSRDAATLACSADPGSMANAVGMIAACQCHNGSAANRIMENPATVLRVLRKSKGC